MNQQGPFPTSGETTSSVSPGRSIRLFLADGTPQGLMIGEVVNWTGQALAAPRGRIEELLKRPEAARTGIYILSGPDPDRVSGLLAYIGEADNVAARLRHHLRAEEKDFFDRIAIIVAKDDNLTKAHARFLEGQLMRLAKETGVATLTNSVQPDYKLLPEADRADMGYFISQVRLILPALGFNLFRGPVERSTSAGVTLEDASANGTTLFTLSAAGATALAREADDAFVVLAGSTARRAGTETFPSGYRALRDELVQERRLVEGTTPDLYRFATDVAFSSPSAAASVIAARSASGPREWVVKGTGQSYRDWRAARLDLIEDELAPACESVPSTFTDPQAPTPPSEGSDRRALQTPADGR